MKSNRSLRNELKPILCLGVLACLWASVLAEPIESLERRFVELPMEARRLTGPLFWLHGDESAERLEMYVEKVAEGGNGCFTAESRPHNDWLGPGWYRDLAICLEAAKEHNLHMWIFDEKWWPSGEVGGKVPQEYACKTIHTDVTEVTGPASMRTDVARDRRIAVLAGRSTADGIDGDSLIDLSQRIRDNRLDWQVPPGDWKVMVFTWNHSRGHQRNWLVDGASRDAVEWYIRTVYQPHYDHFKDDFGTWIPGFFYDEPETPGDWGTEVLPLLKERGVDWKKALVAWTLQLAGDEHAAARYQYQDALAEAWGRTLYGGLTQWCHDHGVQSIGHFLEHNFEYLHPQLCAGNMFQLQKYSDMGGIDAVFSQFTPGRRNMGLWQTPKLGSSITHAYGKKDDVTMVEIYGARGQDVTYAEMKWWSDLMHVAGVNFHIPHSFNPRSPFDRDCPPYFYNGGFEPRWPLYRVLADYTSRLSVMLTGGRHVCPVALLYLGNSAHVGRHIRPEQMSTALQDALYDCDWIPYEVFEADTTLADEHVVLREERYRILIVPPVEVIPYATLEKAVRFFEQGGVVVEYGFVPSLSATLGKSREDVAALCRALWGETPKPGLTASNTHRRGGRSYLLPAEPTPEQLQRVLADDAGVRPTLQVVRGDTNHWLHVLHRVKDGRDMFFITNQNIEGPARRFRLRCRASGVPECWDPLRGHVTRPAFDRDGSSVLIDLTLEPYESQLLVFNDSRRRLPRRIEGDRVRPLGTIPLAARELPELPPARPVVEEDPLARLDGLSWVWFPEENPAATAAPGTVYFRRSFTLPADAKIATARFIGTADNGMRLYVNGRAIEANDGTLDDWGSVSKINLVELLRPGRNTVAIEATNASTTPNPAGLIGKIVVSYGNGRTLELPVDKTWKTARQAADGWRRVDFDDAAWPAAVECAAFGAGPWGMLSDQRLTVSPVLRAEPYEADFDLPQDFDADRVRLVLEMKQMRGEQAARVTVNGQYAGGVIERPLRLDISAYVRPGANVLRIEPFSPVEPRLVLYPW
ncbi:MAG TPA: hypothetical protein ENN87_13530 [Phycisphaerales bacterium]|nr:hypothetical protein [Phycisphaerales bacterium]